jgi:four helix bundle protein
LEQRAWSLEQKLKAEKGMIKYQFENLIVWQKGMELVKTAYKITKQFPKEEQFGLTSQIRRAAVSVPVNIAEGRGRQHKAEYIQFLYTARGSLYEMLTLVQVSTELEFMRKQEAQELDSLCRDLIGMLQGLINSIK